ncbi:DUF6492 family protein [Kordiimonas sp.]|uniref:DUF6492 family protein n=1 Tax=Kordiimonas sp. TaxID=1970157 RepID=UPI003A923304
MIDIVTTVYSGDYMSLILQARSFEKHLDSDFVGKIFAVYNSDDYAVFARYFETKIKPQYGRFQNRVVLLQSSDLLAGADLSKYPPWYIQMANKLFISQHVGSPWFLALDCKNHFIRRASAETLFAETKAVSFLQFNEKNLSNFYEGSFGFIGTELFEAGKVRMPAWTPYIMQTATTRTLLGEHFGGDAETFLSAAIERQLTEFYVYEAYVRKAQNVENLYSFGKPFVSTVWAKSTLSDKKFDRCIKRTTRTHCLCFGVHRKSYLQMSQAQWHAVVDLWETYELISGPEGLRLKATHASGSNLMTGLELLAG